MKHEVNIDDFLTLIYWVQTYVTIEGMNFKHEKLLTKARIYKKLDMPLNTEVDNIDDLILDAKKVYEKLNLNKVQVFNIMNTIDIPYMPKISKEFMIKEIEGFEHVFEDIIENYKFENSEIRNMQKNAANEKMKQCVDIEDYENAAKFRDLIKEY
jgi:hypothetical protein